MHTPPAPPSTPTALATAPAGRLITESRRQVFLVTQGVCLAIAVFLSLLGGHFFINLTYSLCIGNLSSLFVNGGRVGVVRWQQRHGHAARPLGHALWPGWPWMLTLVSAGGVLGYVAGNWLAYRLLQVLSVPLQWQDHPFHGSGDDWRGWLAILVISIAASLGVMGYFYSRATMALSEAAAQAAARTAAQTQLKLLQSQLEPHMLFNTLANLRVLIGVDAERAQEMLDQLIAFLRATLSASQATLHPLQAEFDRIADYLALMQVRMGSRLGVTLALPPELAAQPVPPLLLQPLVENAIKHGLEPLRRGGHITVSAQAQAGQLVLRVLDTGRGLHAAAQGPEVASAANVAGLGFGTVQIRERLATLYGPHAHLHLDDAPEGGTCATLTLPWTPPAASGAAATPAAAPLA